MGLRRSLSICLSLSLCSFLHNYFMIVILVTVVFIIIITHISHYLTSLSSYFMTFPFPFLPPLPPFARPRDRSQLLFGFTDGT